jgi:hypothetical protein
MSIGGLRDRYPERRAVSQAQLELARAAWTAFPSPAPAHLTELLRQDSSALPFLSGALWRHLQQFPSKRNGLSRSEHQALEAYERRDFWPVLKSITTVKRRVSGDDTFAFTWKD